VADRIPRTALVIGGGEVGVPLPVEEITIGSMVMVRHGEVLHSTANCGANAPWSTNRR
jgi:hypothetical protein